MIERIGTAITAQPETVKSVKPSQNAKTKPTSENEQLAVQTNDIRKRDRFERSSEVSRTSSPDVPQTQNSFDEKQSAAKASNSRNYDRLEISGKYISELSEKTNEGVKADDISKSDISAVKSDDVGDSSSEKTASQEVSYDSSSEDVDTNKLYQYTDTELKDFLIDGTITQSEYDREIAKREY